MNPVERAARLCREAYRPIACAGDMAARTTELTELGYVSHGMWSDGTVSAFTAENDEQLTIAFQGTRDVKEALLDLRANLVPWRRGRVHAGALAGMQSLLPWVQACVANLGSRELEIDGHSLGALLGNLMALQLQREVWVYTFGSPKVGDADWIADYETLDAVTVRCVHDQDIITQVPGGCYEHVGGQLRLGDDGTELHQQHGIYEYFGSTAETVLADFDGRAERDHHIDTYCTITHLHALKAAACAS